MLSRAELLADVVIAIGYRDSEVDVPAVVAEITRVHGRVPVADLDPDAFAAIIARHTHRPGALT